jgi:hypothetical protein
VPDSSSSGKRTINRTGPAGSSSGTLDLPPVLRQPVKTQNPFKGELSHGVIT